MRKLIVILLAFTLASCVAQYVKTPDTTVIKNDNGGDIMDYMLRYTLLDYKKSKVVIDGYCLSACTLVFGFVAPSNICATSNAVLGFHAPRIISKNGTEIRDDPESVESVEFYYPKNIVQWIHERGGLHRYMIYLYSPELFKYVKQCEYNK